MPFWQTVWYYIKIIPISEIAGPKFSRHSHLNFDLISQNTSNIHHSDRNSSRADGGEVVFILQGFQKSHLSSNYGEGQEDWYHFQILLSHGLCHFQFCLLESLFDSGCGGIWIDSEVDWKKVFFSAQSVVALYLSDFTILIDIYEL